ncbi:MAG: hypothetical protein RLZZ450_1896 [Pseudomonadota bacterium]
MLHPVELAHWLQILLNRPPALDAEAPFWSLYQHEGRVLDSCPVEPSARARPDLLVVITTYARPDSFRQGLVQLHETLDAVSPTPSVRVLVLNDRSQADYDVARAEARALFGDDLTWLDAHERLGKPGFWKAYQVAFLVARAVQPAFALFLQDDLEYAPSLLRDAQASWQSAAHDVRRRVLYLFASRDDERFGRWVVYPRRAESAHLYKTQWFDLQAFLVDRAFFELLDYRMVPIHHNRWRRWPRISSGVGQQLTIRLWGRGNVYQTRPGLVLHGAQHSEMNPAARARRPLDNRGDVPSRRKDS